MKNIGETRFVGWVEACAACASRKTQHLPWVSCLNPTYKKWRRFLGWVEARSRRVRVAQNPTSSLGFVPQPNLQKIAKVLGEETRKFPFNE